MSGLVGGGNVKVRLEFRQLLFRTSGLSATITFLYLATYKRIREAYRIFLKDMWKKISKKNVQECDKNQTGTSAWWIELRKYKNEENQVPVF